jgi:predicted RNA-binding protein associated with RNAse of E/G family
MNKSLNYDLDKLQLALSSGEITQEQYEEEYEAFIDTYAYDDFCDEAYGRD